MASRLSLVACPRVPTVPMGRLVVLHPSDAMPHRRWTVDATTPAVRPHDGKSTFARSLPVYRRGTTLLCVSPPSIPFARDLSPGESWDKDRMRRGHRMGHDRCGGGQDRPFSLSLSIGRSTSLPRLHPTPPPPPSLPRPPSVPSPYVRRLVSGSIGPSFPFRKGR